MAQHKIFLTGSTGYIGGSVLDLLLKSPEKYSIVALVRTADAAAKLKSLNVTPLLGSLDDAEILAKASRNADVVIHTAHADHMGAAQAIVAGLSQKEQRGILIHTSGTGILVDGARGNRGSDDIYSDLDMAKIHAIPLTNPHRDVDQYLFDNDKNISIHIVCPPTIFGRGTGPFNQFSQQIPGAARAFKELGYAGTIGKGLNIWNSVHVLDLAEFYVLLLEKTLEGTAGLGGREGGFYFVESGQYLWKDAIEKIAQALFHKGLIKQPDVTELKPEVVDKFFGPLGWEISSANSRSKAERSRALGWKPHWGSDILASIEPEVDALFSEKK